MEFANKEYLFLLLLLLPYIVWFLMFRKKSEPTIRMADTFAFRNAPKSWRVRLMPLQMVLRMLVFVLVVLALARPQTHNSWKKKNVEGIDIALAVDVSTSMLAADLTPNRIEAAKQVAAEFIADRPNDNIGLVIFAGESFTQCPLTADHASLLSLLQSVRTDIAARGLIEDGTAIGMGLATAVNRLKESKAKSKVVILLTDGTNNSGEISPQTAAEFAKRFGIRVYTIGVGRSGVVQTPVTHGTVTEYIQVRSGVDEEMLTEIAHKTDGKFYLATNTRELQQIYGEVDKLEKTKLSVKQFKKHEEAYQPFVLAAIVLLLLEILLRITIFRRIP